MTSQEKYGVDKNNNPLLDGTPIRKGDVRGTAILKEDGIYILTEEGEEKVSPEDIIIDITSLIDLYRINGGNMDDKEKIASVIAMEPAAYTQTGDDEYTNCINGKKICTAQYIMMRNTCMNCGQVNEPTNMHTDICDKCGKSKTTIKI